jgi:hypothetical protein
MRFGASPFSCPQPFSHTRMAVVIQHRRENHMPDMKALAELDGQRPRRIIAKVLVLTA